MDTASCLSRYPWRTLVVLAEVYDVTAHHHRSKGRVVRELAAAIRENLPDRLAALNAEARAAIVTLAQAHALSLPRSEFVARFGALHPYRPWNPDAPAAPWPAPTSPASVLVHHGLAYPVALGSRRRPLDVVLLPEDLRDQVAEQLGVASPPSSVLTASLLPYTYDLETEVFTFLSFLNRQDYAVRHDRWLPPRALKALNAFLSPPDSLGSGRSELQAERIPFVHYLAERTGLVHLVGDGLKPGTAALDWLNGSQERRLRVLWEAWLEDSQENRTLWRRYRLPALDEDDDPVVRFRTLLASLAACPPRRPIRAGKLLAELGDREPALLRPQSVYDTWAALDPGEREDFAAHARAVLLTLLTGPLVWFGILTIIREGDAGPDDERSASDPGTIFQITDLGAALLAPEGSSWPREPAPAPLRIAPLLDRTEGPEAILIDAPPGLPLADRFALEAIVPPDPQGSQEDEEGTIRAGRYRLTRAHLLHALQRGHSLEGVVNFLERASGSALSAPVLGALYRWEEAFGSVDIRHTVLFQARDANLMSDLSAQRRIRETLGDTLNARTVEVRTDRSKHLLRRLESRGLVPRLDLPAEAFSLRQTEEGIRADVEDAGVGERAALAVALRVYAHLADALGLSSRPAYALLRRWCGGLPLPLRDAVDHRVAEVVEALHRASPEEAYVLPAPTGQLLDALEEAIAAGETVQIVYYTAGRAHRTVRQVDPLRLEWRGDVVYLIAHCHLRGDQRVFRVDRIADLQRVEAERGPSLLDRLFGRSGGEGG